MAVCATPWRHRGQDEREAVLVVAVRDTVGPLGTAELCIDCAADRARIAVAEVRERHLAGEVSATATITIGPVES